MDPGAVFLLVFFWCVHVILMGMVVCSSAVMLAVLWKFTLWLLQQILEER